MDQKEFAEKVVQYVRNALPEELSEAEVRAAGLDLWAGGFPQNSHNIRLNWNMSG